MVCLIKLHNSSVTGWIIAQDMEELIDKLRARAAFDEALKQPLEALRHAKGSGKTLLGNGYVLLADEEV